MRFFTVHERPGAKIAGGDDIVLICSGFSWSAALFTPIWLIWYRLWLGLALYLLLMLPLGLLLEMIDIADPADLLIGAAIAFLFGCSGADFRRWTLARRGWRLAAVVAAGDAWEAELRYRSLATSSQPPTMAPAMASALPMQGSFDPLPRLV